MKRKIIFELNDEEENVILMALNQYLFIYMDDKNGLTKKQNSKELKKINKIIDKITKYYPKK